MTVQTGPTDSSKLVHVIFAVDVKPFCICCYFKGPLCQALGLGAVQCLGSACLPLGGPLQQPQVDGSKPLGCLQAPGLRLLLLLLPFVLPLQVQTRLALQQWRVSISFCATPVTAGADGRSQHLQQVSGRPNGQASLHMRAADREHTVMLAVVYASSVQTAHRARAARVTLASWPGSCRRHLSTHLLSPPPWRRRICSNFCRGQKRELLAGTSVFVVSVSCRHARDARSWLCQSDAGAQQAFD